ncbi:MAG: hypothetical protein ACXABY_09430 [Candidatus Thorarchaeota archaeon]|jgi:hypothetical protein
MGGREGRAIPLPEYVWILTKGGKETVHGLIAFLNSLIEEGVVRVSTYAERIGAPSTQTGVLDEPKPVKCGLIATLAKDVLMDSRHRWNRMGFMSRMLPVSYTYSVGTKTEIHRSIAKRDYAAEAPVTLSLPSEDVEVQLGQKQADDLLTLTTVLASQLGSSSGKKRPNEVYGFRLQKHIQRLAMASALKDGRQVVSDMDVALIKDLAQVINLEYYPL